MNQQWKWLDRLFFGIFFGIIACAMFIYLFETDAGAEKVEACVEINPKGRDLGLVEDELAEPIILDQVRLDVPLLNQMDAPRLYNGCEVTSLAMLLNYYDVEVTKNQLAERTPNVSYRTNDGLRGNPNQGFVGDMTGNGGPGYFVYHEPIFELAEEYIPNDLEVIDLTDSDFSTIQEYLSQDAPVWVITTTTFSDTQNNQVWQTNEGDVTISMSEHSVVLTGYDAKNVYLNDPYGNKNFATNLERFVASWQQLGSQAITIVHK